MYFTQRVSSIKTRIKTKNKIMIVNRCNLREYLPLKQGLRLSFTEFAIIVKSQRVSSIKTRIKTAIFVTNYENQNSQRVSSIKTRIKTLR